MAKRNIKETLLSTLVHGEETLNNIEVMRKLNRDKITAVPTDLASKRLHPDHLSLIVNEIIDTNKGAKIIRLTSEDGYLPPFMAGQYINVIFDIDGVRTTRPYSLSSSPKQRGYYEITVAEVKNGYVSDYVLNNVKLGDRLETSGPSGHFVFNAAFHKKKSLFLAGGSSITPFLSMVRDILLSGEERDVILLYGSRTLSTAIYHEELSKLSEEFPNLSYHLVLSEQDPTYSGNFGFLDENIIRKYAPDFLERTAYISGPNVMHHFCKNALLNMGMKRKDIRDEVFGNSSDITKEEGWPSDVTSDMIFNLKVGDKVIPAKASESILVALERANIRVNVCCRSGECSLCRVKLVKGKAYLANGMLLRLADQKFGYIHSCKSYPISDLEIEL